MRRRSESDDHHEGVKEPLMMRPALIFAAVMALLSAIGLAQAVASVPHPAVVSENPADQTPHVRGDLVEPRPKVLALARQGSTMYAGGIFHSVQDASGGQPLTRLNLMSFDASSGAVSNFAPMIEGPNAAVWALAATSSALYVAGRFATVDGVERPNLVKIDLETGTADASFNAPSVGSGRVTEVRLVEGRLIVAGSFPRKLIALDPDTGTGTGYLRATIAGSVSGDDGPPTEVYRFAVDPDRSRLVAVGNFTSVNGQPRKRAFMLNLPDTTASLNNWYYPPLGRLCQASNPDKFAYLRDVDFSPAGQYFVLVSTGFVPRTTDGIGRDLCDAAARFETDIREPERPTWINYTGGDTLQSVAATGATVYVQGHQRWMDNPYGRNDAGPGAVERRGIAALDPVDGQALPWNPRTVEPREARTSWPLLRGCGSVVTA